MRLLRRHRFLPVLVLAAALAVQAAPGASMRDSERATRSPSDLRAYPRTYHLWGSDSNVEALARYDLAVGHAYWNLPVLRRRNPGGIYLLTPGLHPGDARDYRALAVTYGALDRWPGGSDRLRGGPRLGSIRPFDPHWDFLHDADGNRAQVNGTFRHGGWNLADPARRGTPELVAKVFAHASKLSGLYRRGWDGVHSDNWIYRIGVGWFYGSDLDTDRDGKVDDYAVLRRNWATGLTRVGLLLRKYLPGKFVGGNGNWSVRPGNGTDFRPYLPTPDAHLKSSNYTLLEGLEMYTSRADEVIATIREWLRYRDPRALPRYFAILHKLGAENDYKSMRWGLSLATIAGAHYEAYAGSHADMFWYDEYDGALGVRRRHWLGRPISAPTKLPTGVWRRDFRNGLVLNNSTGSPQTIVLGGTYRLLEGVQDLRVNSGEVVERVIVPAQDGLFLRRDLDAGG